MFIVNELNSIEMKLKDMYDEHFCCDGRCKCFNDCSKKMDFDYESSIICNRNLKVGKYYGEKTKVLFIGKENTHRSESLTPVEPESFLTQKNQHYKRTKFMLSAFLDECNEADINNYDGYNFTSSNEDTLHKYFALTNHYHCAYKKKADANKYHGITSDNTMWYNCVEIVRKEIEILEPDVVVIQSGWSAKEKALKDIRKYFSENWDVKQDKLVGLYKAENKESGRVCYVIGSYHPSFHCWHEEKYLGLLKKRIIKTRNILYKGE